MKEKNNKNKIIFIILILVIFSIIFLIFKQKSEITDSKKFAKEYTEISSNNVFVYKNIDEIIKILEKGTGIVYLGFPECPWCQRYVKYLNQVANDIGIDKIYYFNISKDRENNTKEYQKIISLLTGKLQYDDEGNERIYVPNVTFIINGEIIGNNYESSKDTLGMDNPDDYWTKDRINNLKEELTIYMEQIYEYQNMCTECTE